MNKNSLITPFIDLQKNVKGLSTSLVGKYM